ncbi:MAG: sugar ABC transporter permease [Candidatus Dormiibacterota bacterium]
MRPSKSGAGAAGAPDPLRLIRERAFPRRRRSPNDTALLGYLLVIPVVSVLVLLVGYPFVYSAWVSFTNTTVGVAGRFVGFANYLTLVEDPTFRVALVNTVVYVAAVEILKLSLGLAVASLLMQPLRGRNLWRALVLLPWAMPGFVAYILWKLIYDPTDGALNILLLGLGLKSPISFLGDPTLALPSVILLTVWQGFPFWVIMFLAAMQGVSKEYYEAAKIDGAGGWSRFVHITIPSIRSTIWIVLMLSTIVTANAFAAIWLTTQGGPANATTIIPIYAYLGLQNLKIGSAAADSLVLVPILLAFLALVRWRMVRADA